MKYLEKLRDQAIIEWKNDDLKKAYEVFLAQPGRAARQLELSRPDLSSR